MKVCVGTIELVHLFAFQRIDLVGFFDGGVAAVLFSSLEGV